MKISVIIPVFNECTTIKALLQKVKAQPFEKEIIIVDDGSDQDTKRALRKISDNDPEIKLITHKKNFGKGASIRTGINHATGEYTIIQDGDLEYDPDEYQILLKPLIDGKSDVVYGSRFIGARRVFLFWHHMGNKLLTFICNLLYNTNLTDLMTCYKFMKTEYLRMFDLKSNRFEIEAEITAKVFKSKLRVFEIPITYEGRGYEEGKKTKWLDGLKVLRTLIKYRFWVRSVGEETLRRISKMKKFNWWIYNKIEPWVGSRVAEAGCGTGNISRLLFQKEFFLGIDFEHDYINELKNKFSYIDNAEFIQGDLQNLNTEKLKNHKLDTIICINVLEHLQEDKKALQGFFDILEPGGKLILIVPALKFLYNSLDKFLSHHRRYDRDELESLLKNIGFKTAQSSYFNMFGIPGWYLSGNIMKRKILPSGQLKLYEYLVPLFNYTEKLLGPPVGLSLFIVAEKIKED